MEHLARRGRNGSRDWIHIERGLHWQPSWPDVGLDELRARQLLLPPTAAFSHLTAASVYGWWVSASIDHPVFVAQSTVNHRARRDGTLVCRHPQTFPINVREGVRLATPAEALLSCARDLGVLDLVVLGDSALREGHCGVPDLWRAARQRRRGAPLLRRVIPLLDPRSESPWESIMRVLYAAAEIPVVPQYEVRNTRGDLIARADFRIVGTNQLHEYDGGGHRAPDVHATDLSRARHLSDESWVRVGLTSRDLRHDYPSLIASTDGLLSRPWSRDRIEAWELLLRESLFDPRWRARAHRRWRQQLDRPVTDQ